MINLPPGETAWLGASRADDILSVGLVVEPEHFVNYYFSDREATRLIGYTRTERAQHIASVVLPGAEPAFGVMLTTDFTLVPPALFHESECNEYLGFTTYSGVDVPVQHERLIRSDIYLITREDIDAQAYASRLHPGLALRHGAGVLIEAGTALQHDLAGECIYLHQAGHLYTVVVFSGRKLLLAQNILSPYLEDVRYFVLYTAKMLSLNENFKLILLGEAASHQALLDSLQPHVAHISQGTAGLQQVLPEGLDAAQYARHFIAIHAMQ